MQFLHFLKQKLKITLWNLTRNQNFGHWQGFFLFTQVVLPQGGRSAADIDGPSQEPRNFFLSRLAVASCPGPRTTTGSWGSTVMLARRKSKKPTGRQPSSKFWVYGYILISLCSVLDKSHLGADHHFWVNTHFIWSRILEPNSFWNRKWLFL